MGEFGDLACVVCKQIDYLPGNQLVECQECHSLYHQECHKPPATQQEISDPRSIWYCAKCTKNMKKISSKSSKSVSASGSRPCVPTASSAFEEAINIGKETALQIVKEKREKEKEKKQEALSSTIPYFKRAEVKPTSSSSLAPAAAKPVGLAGLAANINRSAPVATTGSSTSLSTTLTPSTSAADKRLQMMKKKAAKANEAKKRVGK